MAAVDALPAKTTQDVTPPLANDTATPSQVSALLAWSTKIAKNLATSVTPKPLPAVK